MTPDPLVGIFGAAIGAASLKIIEVLIPKKLDDAAQIRHELRDTNEKMTERMDRLQARYNTLYNCFSRMDGLMTSILITIEEKYPVRAAEWQKDLEAIRATMTNGKRESDEK